MNKRISLMAAAAMCAASLLAGSAIKAPAFLKPGDKIAIITPASAIDTAPVDPGYNVLQRWGLNPVKGKYALERLSTGFAGICRVGGCHIVVGRGCQIAACRTVCHEQHSCECKGEECLL